MRKRSLEHLAEELRSVVAGKIKTAPKLGDIMAGIALVRDTSLQGDLNVSLGKQLQASLESLPSGSAETARLQAWLRALSIHESKWKRYKNASAISTLRGRLAARLFEKQVSGRLSKAEACKAGLALDWDGPSIRQRVEGTCKQAADEKLKSIEAGIRPSAPLRTRLALDSVASALPLTSSQHNAAMAILKRLSQPARSKAAATKSNQARAFYLAIADSIDGGKSVQPLRQGLLNQAKGYFRPEIRTQNNSSGACRSLVSSALSSAGDRQRSSSAPPVTVALSVTSCSADFTSRWRPGRTERKVRQECEDVAVESTRRVQETKTYDCVSEADGKCEYQGTTNKTTTTTKRVCKDTPYTVYTGKVENCTKLNLQGYGTVTYSGGQTKTIRATPLQKRECDSVSATYRDGQSPPRFEEDKGKRDRAIRSHFQSELLRPLKEAAANAQRVVYNRRLSSLRGQLAALEKSSDIEDRIAAGVLSMQIAYIESKGNAVKLPASLTRLVSEPNALRPLERGSTRTFSSSRFAEQHKSNRTRWSDEVAKKQEERKARFTGAQLESKRAIAKVSSEETSKIEARIPEALWQSTGRILSPMRGPAASEVRINRTDSSPLAFQLDAIVDQRFAAGQSRLQTSWQASLAYKRLHFSAGGNVPLAPEDVDPNDDDMNDRNDLSGHQFAARWVSALKGPNDPYVSWSAGLQYESLAIGSRSASATYTLPLELSIPLWDWISADLLVKPDLYQLSDKLSLRDIELGESNVAYSEAFGGLTITRLDGRLLVHAAVGSALDGNSLSSLLWRTQVGFRF